MKRAKLKTPKPVKVHCQDPKVKKQTSCGLTIDPKGEAHYSTTSAEPMAAFKKIRGGCSRCRRSI
jgi:hypothetical protein